MIFLSAMAVLACAAALASADAGFYEKTAVKELTPSNFDAEVLNWDGVVFVEFYAPWCGHCKALTPEWTKAANALKGVVKVVAVNADEHRVLGEKYGVQGFPTIKIFALNKKSPSNYEGGRTAKDIIAAAMKEAQSMVEARAGGKTGSSGGSSSGGSGGSGGGGGGGASAVVVLTDANFKQQVMGDNALWLVEFFAPWCGHCKNLKPEWEKVAREYAGEAGVKLATVDATVETSLAQKYEIKGYPTIKVFRPGNKENPEDYQGGRSAADISSFVKGNMAMEAPEVRELTDASVFEKYCAKSSLCMIAFLPHILDSKAAGRRGYLDILGKVADKHKQAPTTWVWAEAMAHPELEAAFNVGGAGYPALVALNLKKNVSANFMWAFDEKKISEFIAAISLGSKEPKTLKAALPAIGKVPKWDGKDAQAPVEDGDHEL